MEILTTIKPICQLVIALGIYNVWLIRVNKKTPYRGGTANNMAEEFRVYGLPSWFMRLVMVLKLTFATMILAGIVKTELALIGAAGLAMLMVGAILMHIKVKDPLMKSVPAALMLLLCAFVYFLSQPESIQSVSN